MLPRRDDLRLLVDSAGDGASPLSNAAAWGAAPPGIDGSDLSRIRRNHVGGQEGLLAVNGGTTVYASCSLSTDSKDKVGASARAIEADQPGRPGPADVCGTL